MAGFLLWKAGKWHCPTCGGPVRNISRGQVQPMRELAADTRQIRELTIGGREWTKRVSTRSWRWYRTRPVWAQIAIVVAIVAFLAIPSDSEAATATASASTTSCKAGYYSPGLDDTFPAVDKLRARNLPRLTSGYAPRCLVAESVAGAVQYYWSEHYHAPRRVNVMGARWYSGKWTIRYRLRSNGHWSWGEFTARKVGKPARSSPGRSTREARAEGQRGPSRVGCCSRSR